MLLLVVTLWLPRDTLDFFILACTNIIGVTAILVTCFFAWSRGSLVEFVYKNAVKIVHY